MVRKPRKCRENSIGTLSPRQRRRPRFPAQVAPAAALPKPTLMTERPEDERAIRAVADTFTSAYNAGDAKTVAALFSEDAEMIDEHGERIKGRPTIQAFFEAMFQGARGRRSKSRRSHSLSCRPTLPRRKDIRGSNRARPRRPRPLAATVSCSSSRGEVAIFQCPRRRGVGACAPRTAQRARMAPGRMGRRNRRLDRARNSPLVAR